MITTSSNRSTRLVLVWVVVVVVVVDYVDADVVRVGQCWLLLLLLLL